VKTKTQVQKRGGMQKYTVKVLAGSVVTIEVTQLLPKTKKQRKRKSQATPKLTRLKFVGRF
jgi:hypothetical protein